MTKETRHRKGTSNRNSLLILLNVVAMTPILIGAAMNVKRRELVDDQGGFAQHTALVLRANALVAAGRKREAFPIPLKRDCSAAIKPSVCSGNGGVSASPSF